MPGDRATQRKRSEERTKGAGATSDGQEGHSFGWELVCAGWENVMQDGPAFIPCLVKQDVISGFA